MGDEREMAETVLALRAMLLHGLLLLL